MKKSELIPPPTFKGIKQERPLNLGGPIPPNEMPFHHMMATVVTVKDVKELRQQTLGDFMTFIFYASKRDKTFEADYYPLLFFHNLVGEEWNTTPKTATSMIDDIYKGIANTDSRDMLKSLSEAIKAWLKLSQIEIK